MSSPACDCPDLPLPRCAYWCRKHRFPADSLTNTPTTGSSRALSARSGYSESSPARRVAGFASPCEGIHQFHAGDATGSVAMAMGCLPGGANQLAAMSSLALLPFEHHADIIDSPRRWGFRTPRRVRRASAPRDPKACFTRAQIVRHEQHRDARASSVPRIFLMQAIREDRHRPPQGGSSTIRISGSTWIAVANASRTYMPARVFLHGALG